MNNQNQAMMAIYVKMILRLVSCVNYCLFYFETASNYVGLAHMECAM